MTAPQISAPTRRSAPLRRGILAGSILALLAGQSLAQTWNGGGGDNSWGTGANWAGGLAPAPGALTDLIFAGLVRLTPIFNYTDGDDFHDITFAAGAGAFTINPDTGVASKGIDWFGSITNSSASVQTLGSNHSTGAVDHSRRCCCPRARAPGRRCRSSGP